MFTSWISLLPNTSLALLFVLSGSLMISKTLHIPKV